MIITSLSLSLPTLAPDACAWECGVEGSASVLSAPFGVALMADGVFVCCLPALTNDDPPVK